MKSIYLLVFLLISCSSPKASNTSPSYAQSRSNIQTEDIVGIWDMSVNTPRGNRENQLEITFVDGKYMGQTEKDTFSITKEDNQLRWKSKIQSPRGSLQANYVMEVTGNEMSGTIKASGRTLNAKGQKR
ncbi:MAG: hypothetical protein AAF363_19280 [Bacteroidota bacterium]